MLTNKVGPENSWRMVHDEQSVLALFESHGFTVSINFIFEGETKEECLAEATRLGLSLPIEEEVS